MSALSILRARATRSTLRARDALSALRASDGSPVLRTRDVLSALRAGRPPRTRGQRTAFWGYVATAAFAGTAVVVAALAPAPPPKPVPRPLAAFAPGLERAFAVAYHPAGPRPRWVYVACPGRVVRYRVSFDGEVIVPAYASSQTPSPRSAADRVR